MTSTTGGSLSPHASARSVTVACFLPPTATLPAALRSRFAADSVRWDIRDAGDLPTAATVDLAICDVTATATATARFATAGVLTLVPEQDDGEGVIAALDAGASACARGEDPTLVAAHLAALARRRGLLPTPEAEELHR